MAGLVPAIHVFLAVNMSAQDIRGLEICTAEKDIGRRTSCLQSNVELLQQELTKQTRRAADDRAAAAKEMGALKTDLSNLRADLAALKTALAKAQDEIAELKKKPAEKK
jgi:septal ring factor EnvC (AmiA/AmiB activator)